MDRNTRYFFFPKIPCISKENVYLCTKTILVIIIITMERIREHLGDLKLIDFMYANEECNEARLVLVTVGYIDDSKEMQTALFDKRKAILSIFSRKISNEITHNQML